MNQEELNRVIDGLTGQTLQMVRRRRQEMPPPVPRPVAEAPLPWDFHLRPQSPPHRQLTGPLTAPLRDAARRSPLQKTVTISRAAFDTNCAESCSICLATHKKGDSIVTECNHEFGKECFNNWISAPNSNHSCPTCRKSMPRITLFKTRSQRNSTPNVIEEEANEELMIF
jgi:hypothetical protein